MATYYVATTGNDSNPGTIGSPKLTIAAGLLLLSGGDTLYIRAGTYHERINTVTQFIPSGSSWATATIISAYPGETVWLDGHGGGGQSIIINLANITGVNTALRYVIFDGVNVNGSNVSGGDGAIGTGNDGLNPSPDHLRFQNYEIKLTNSSNGSPGGYAPAHIINGTFLEFINVHMHHNGLGITPVDGFGGYGIYINGSDHLIENCNIHDNGGYGIQCYKQSGGADRVTIRNNILANNSRNSTSTTGGVVVASGSGHKVYNNIVYGNFDGIEVNGTDCLIYNNTVYGNSSQGIVVAAEAVRAIVKNNIAYGNTVANITNDGSGHTFSNNLQSNPLFTNAAGADFTLTPFSDAIDAGTPNIASGVTLTNFIGSAPDIGALEFGEGEPPPVNFQQGFALGATGSLVFSKQATLSKSFSLAANTLLDVHENLNDGSVFEDSSSAIAAKAAVTFGTPKKALHVTITF